MNNNQTPAHPPHTKTINCTTCHMEWDTTQNPNTALADALAHVSRRHPGADPFATIKEGPLQ